MSGGVGALGMLRPRGGLARLSPPTFDAIEDTTALEIQRRAC